MHVVVMGCGRVGMSLAHSLDDGGHSVSVVDQDASAFRKLGPHFGGQTVTGIGFDRTTLLAAGIERAHAFAAVSSGDNSNIISARVARETFSVANVVARIYDPKRAEVYQRLGIPTVASVAWQTDQILRRMLPGTVAEEWRDPSGTVTLVDMPYADSWVGERTSLMEKETGARVAFVTRYGETVLPTSETVLQADDVLHVLVRPDRQDEVAGQLGYGPEGH